MSVYQVHATATLEAPSREVAGQRLEAIARALRTEATLAQNWEVTAEEEDDDPPGRQPGPRRVGRGPGERPSSKHRAAAQRIVHTATPVARKEGQQPCQQQTSRARLLPATLPSVRSVLTTPPPPSWRN